MNRKPDMYDVIALLEELPRQRTSTPLGAYCCTEGEIGTVVMIHPDGACEGEFADRDGQGMCNFAHLAREVDDFARCGRLRRRVSPVSRFGNRPFSVSE